MHPYLYDVLVAAVWIAVVIALMYRWSNDAPDPSNPHRTPRWIPASGEQARPR